MTYNAITHMYEADFEVYFEKGVFNALVIRNALLVVLPVFNSLKRKNYKHLQVRLNLSRGYFAKNCKLLINECEPIPITKLWA